MMQQSQIGRRVQTIVFIEQFRSDQHLFYFFVARLGQLDLPLLFVNREISFLALKFGG